ncbi:MAG TPA: VOC family protein [Verrucomicrobiae bacterium]|nr:VOC family protein [Verrucomicrobiae bacterium]
MSIEVLGIDHIYINVSDLRRSEGFYDKVMKALGFRKGAGPEHCEPCIIDGDPCFHYYNQHLQYTIRQSRNPNNKHDPFSPGLNHICFQLSDREQVDSAANELRGVGIDASTPCLYPEYASDYYAAYFADPDGICLEIVNQCGIRKTIREQWANLDRFVNPLQHLKDK